MKQECDEDRITISEAAVQHAGRVYAGKRHGLIMQTVWAEATAAGQEPPKIPFEEQGFVTSDGRFVNRWQAGAIAYCAGQTKTRKEYLLSEDVW